MSISLIVNTHPTLEIARPIQAGIDAQTDTDFEILRANSQKEYSKLVSMASHDYVVILGANCIPKQGFIATHRKFAKQGVSTWSNRVFLDYTITQHLLANQLHPERWNALDLVKLRISGHCNAVFPSTKRVCPSEFATFGEHKVVFGQLPPLRRLPSRGDVLQLASLDFKS